MVSELRLAVAIGLGLLFGLIAQADDGTVDLDTADEGKTRSLDSVDTGKTDSLDSPDTGSTVDLDAADTGKTVNLDTAESDVPAPVAAPAPVPDIGSAAERAQAQRIREDAVVATRRLDGANAAYSQMMARGYPTGDARALIIRQHETARSAYQQASARYAAYLKQLEQSGNTD